MSEERKERDLPRFGAGETEPKGNLASRARNRTVLLTPDAIGQVRASMNEEGVQDPMNELLPPVSWDYQKPAGPGEEGFKTMDDAPVSRPEGGEMPSRRATGKFTTPLGPSAPRATPMAQTAVMQSPGFGAPAKSQKGPTSSNLRPSMQEQPQVQPRVNPPKSKVIGFLVSFDTDTLGEVFEIRAGRWLITSRPTDHGDFILINDETISPLHAIIRATGEGKVQVLDQLSEFGTGLFKAGTDTEEEIAGTMAAVNHGDTVRFGKRNFVVCMVPKGVTEAKEKE
jgi:hypothetical protein